MFGSELKCLAAVPGVCEEIDPAAIDEFLTYQYIPHPGTIWKGVHKLPPGHFAVFEKGRLTVERYWDFDPRVERPISRGEACERLRELLTDSVRLRMRSDVPLGSFLSGGIDSSLITAVAQSLSSQPVQTFSIGFPVADFDETRYAAQVAEHLGTRHERFEVTPSGVDVIEKLVWHYDEPFGDSSAVPTWYLSKLTRGRVTVALSGDGGDELFAGYERYQALWLSQLLRRAFPVHRLPGIGLVQRLPDSDRRRSVVRRAKRFLEALDQTPARRYLNWLQIFPEALRGRLYNDAFLEQLPGADPFEFLGNCWDASEGRDLITRASISDILSYLPCDLMTKVDIASMAHALEVRQPMLDHRNRRVRRVASGAAQISPPAWQTDPPRRLRFDDSRQHLHASQDGIRDSDRRLVSRRTQADGSRYDSRPRRPPVRLLPARCRCRVGPGARKRAAESRLPTVEPADPGALAPPVVEQVASRGRAAGAPPING